MIVDETNKQILRDLVKKTAPDAKNIPVYTQLGILPKDFGLSVSSYPDWASWVKVFGGPEINGVTLTSLDVKNLRAAVAEVNRLLTDAIGYLDRGRYALERISIKSQQHLKAVGLKPSDFGITRLGDSF